VIGLKTKVGEAERSVR